MSASIKTDTARPGGGYALLRVGHSQLVTSIAIQDRESGDFLSESGKWGKQRIYLPVEPAGEGLVRLGPQIVDPISVDTAVAIYGSENDLVENLIWPALRQSAGGRPNWTVGGGTEEPAKNPIMPPPSTTPRPKLTIVTPPSPKPAPAAGLETTSQSKASKRWTVVATTILFAAAIGYWAWNGSQSEQFLVCAGSQPFAQLSELGLLVPCKKVVPELPKPDPEAEAYEAFHQCTGGSATCSVSACSAAYLAKFPTGLHSTDVQRNQSNAAQACATDKAASQYTEFDQCMRATDNPCLQNGCVEKYRQGVSRDPYSSWLSQRADSASAQCRANNQDEADYAQFTQCVATTDPCDRARCSASLPTRVRNGTHRLEIMKINQAGQTLCRPPQPASPPAVTEPTASAPSYNCRLVSGADELAICASGQLSYLDQQQASIFKSLSNRLDDSSKVRLRDEQRSWLRERSLCHSDEACINSAYHSRILQLQNWR
jgi:hypothetical protein